MYAVLYLFFVLGSMLATVLTFLLAPLLALTAGADGNLPRWLYWFQTFDNTLDAGWKVQGNYGTYLSNGAVPTGFELYRYRVYWLWRNPAYGFDYFPFGVSMADTSQWRVLRNDAAWFVALGPNGQFCITNSSSLKLGWKVWAYYDRMANKWRPADFTWGPQRRTSLCFTLPK